MLNVIPIISYFLVFIFYHFNVLHLHHYFRTIILFDEIEEFCLDRENPSLGMESRMLTTAMLTQLNDLRRKQSVIFIVATNRLRSFDAAVTRPGRFDFLLFVGTPNLSSRELRLSNKLEASRLTAVRRDEIRTLAVDYMTDNWKYVRFMTFAENEALLNYIVDTGIRGDLTKKSLALRIDAITKTATIQGSVQEDYIASESLSRV
jgi:SpoVK/Ycf46/Vps4 family AAA+-type ATPase